MNLGVCQLKIGVCVYKKKIDSNQFLIDRYQNTRAIAISRIPTYHSIDNAGRQIQIYVTFR